MYNNYDNYVPFSPSTSGLATQSIYANPYYGYYPEMSTSTGTKYVTYNNTNNNSYYDSGYSSSQNSSPSFTTTFPSYDHQNFLPNSYSYYDSQKAPIVPSHVQSTPVSFGEEEDSRESNKVGYEERKPIQPRNILASLGE
jgi:hypothetical protein